MTQLVTADLLRQMFGLRNAEDFVAPLNKALNTFGITTPVRVAAFLAQTGHESGGYRALIENLNYSAEGLLKVFGRYFPTPALAAAYARKPAAIASRVYANRMGNGDEASQEGWTYRGKGLIQITGKTNHLKFAAAMQMSLADATAYMLTTEGACMSAAWFWSANGCNTLADSGDFAGLTRRINGGMNGYEDRVKYHTIARRLLGV